MARIRYFLLLPLLVPAILRADDAPATGSISGVVRYTGKVPLPKKILLTDGGTLEHNDLVVDPKTQGLRDVVAVLENAPAQEAVKEKPKVLVDQRDMIFMPRVVAVQHGQVVRFENNDLCNHSVMATSLIDENQFNRVAGPGFPIEHTFVPQKHPVLIGCSLHSWMRAWIYVIPHPWFAVSDAAGRFRMEDVPPGKYTLWLRHADTGLQHRQEIEVKAGQATDVRHDWETTDR